MPPAYGKNRPTLAESALENLPNIV